MTTLLIDGGTVLTMNPDRDIIENGAVLVEDGVIRFVGGRRVGERSERPTRPLHKSARRTLARTGLVGEHPLQVCRPVDQRIDATGKAVLPGLINSHTHLCMIFGRTIGVERDLMSWLDVEVPLVGALDAEALYLAELMGAIENIKNGNTTVVENIFSPQRDGFAPEAAAFRAFQDSGLRAVVARCHQARHFDRAFLETHAQQVRRVEALAEQWHQANEGRLRLAIGPQLPWLVDEAGLKGTQELARRLGIGLHMHVAENPTFNVQIARHFGRPIRNVELLYETGCLGPDTQAVVVADVNDSEIARLAETGTNVVFDPQTRLYWGTGFAPIRQFLDAGLTCALGTNGPAANCGQSIFESMKYACATAKTAARSPTALGCRRALGMATIEAAASLGLDDTIGSLTVGKRADLITVDLAQPHLTPAFDVEAALVYSAGGADVRDVVIDGRIVMRDRKLQTVDENDILARARAAASRAMVKAQIDPATLIAVRERRHGASGAQAG